jgi:hypothetical protein
MALKKESNAASVQLAAWFKKALEKFYKAKWLAIAGH